MVSFLFYSHCSYNPTETKQYHTKFMPFNNSIAILICWYGPYPWYFRYFVHSCSFNPTIDYYIITDNQQQIDYVSKNITVVHKTLNEIKTTISEKLGFVVNLSYPYKLCDFRPAFGVIFSEIVKEYEFWGSSDIDLLYGDIRNFMTEEVLQSYDIISLRPEYVTGFFSLYRNSEFVNLLFKRSQDYCAVFQNRKYLGFDECGFLCDLLMEGASICDLSAEIESITHVTQSLSRKGIIKAYFDLHVVESTPGELQWSKGQLFYKAEYEIMLYHLISFKGHPLLQIPNWDDIPETYFINEFSFAK